MDGLCQHTFRSAEEQCLHSLNKDLNTHWHIKKTKKTVNDSIKFLSRYHYQFFGRLNIPDVSTSSTMPGLLPSAALLTVQRVLNIWTKWVCLCLLLRIVLSQKLGPYFPQMILQIATVPIKSTSASSQWWSPKSCFVKSNHCLRSYEK